MSYESSNAHLLGKQRYRREQSQPKELQNYCLRTVHPVVMICGAKGKVKIHHESSELQQITFHNSKVDRKNQQIEECAKQLRPSHNPANSFSVNGMDGEQHSGQQ